MTTLARELPVGSAPGVARMRPLTLEGGLADAPRRYALTHDGVERGHLLLAHNLAPYRAVTRTRTCDLWVAGRGSWYGVAAHPGADEAIAGYHPGWFLSGTLVLDGDSYRVSRNPLTGTWKLRGADGIIARASYTGTERWGAYLSHAGPLRVELAPARQPAEDLLVLLFVWAVGMEMTVVGFEHGVGGAAAP